VNDEKLRVPSAASRTTWYSTHVQRIERVGEARNPGPVALWRNVEPDVDHRGPVPCQHIGGRVDAVPFESRYCIARRLETRSEQRESGESGNQS